MAHYRPTSKTYGKMILMGIISAALYTALITNQDFILSHWSRGGLAAILPIATAFIFSYFHGSFTGHFWRTLGVEASRKKTEVK